MCVCVTVDGVKGNSVCCYGTKLASFGQLGHVICPGNPGKKCCCFLFICLLTVCCAGFQAVEELLESLELEKSSYHMGLSRVSEVTCTCTLFISLYL